MNFAEINKFLKNPYIQSILFLLFSYLLLPVSLTSNSYICEVDNVNNCLDPSWVLSLNWAIQKHLTFGRDYIFTYGPLGFLSTRNDLGISRFYFVLFDLFIYVNLVSIVLYVFRKFYNLQNIILCFLAILAIADYAMYSNNVVYVLLLISFFWLNYFLKHSKIWSLVIPSIITVLLFYIKINISFVGLAIFYGYFIYFVRLKKENFLQIILFGLAVPISIFLLSFPLMTDIYGYARASLSLVDGYNDAMNIKPGDYVMHTIVAILMISIFSVTFLLKNFKQNFILFSSYIIISYIIFKQAFVRSDLHITIFFTIFPAFTALLTIFGEKVSFIQKGAAISICSICFAIGLSLGIYPSFTSHVNYLENIFSVPDNQQYKAILDRPTLSSEIREIIGDKSVDIMPWNINYLYFNQLNYNPRPVVQSYSAYTAYLADLNNQKYQSDSAPEFVILSNFSIDNRYAFFDDQPAKLTLLKNYFCQGLFGLPGNRFLLFRRSPNNAVINISSPIESFVKFDEEYFLKDTSKSYFIKIDIDYSLFGKAVRTLYKPVPLNMIFTLENGTIHERRIIIPILRNGVLINPFIEDEEDFFNLAKGISNTSVKRIKSFKIKSPNADSRIERNISNTYVKEIKLSVSEFSISRNNQ